MKKLTILLIVLSLNLFAQEPYQLMEVITYVDTFLVENNGCYEKQILEVIQMSSFSAKTTRIKPELVVEYGGWDTTEVYYRDSLGNEVDKSRIYEAH